ncbi:MAG: MerR family transcriptional regulator [Planctomycetia bacterium]|nr:MerR family transcriptional regulator [Planctomycetia bacterium]
MTFDPNEPIIGIGIAAKKLGVSPELLRLYEREGLVVSYKTESGYRLYSERDLEWIDCFRHQITDNKMNIAGVRMLLALMPCWNLKSKCNKKDCQDCKAYKNSNVVCWTLTDQGSKVCRQESCRECAVYRHACTAGKLDKMYVVMEEDEKN